MINRGSIAGAIQARLPIMNDELRKMNWAATPQDCQCGDRKDAKGDKP